MILERLSITFTSNAKREFVPRDQVSRLLVVYCPLFLQINLVVSRNFLSIRIVLSCFYPLIFYFEKFSTWIWRLPYTWSLNSLWPFCSYFQIIVTPLKEKDVLGNTADAKYETVDLTYEDQEQGKPYITAEFSKRLFTTEFPVGDGKYYSRNGVTSPKRKRRAAGKLALNLWVTLLSGVERYVTPHRAWFSW